MKFQINFINNHLEPKILFYIPNDYAFSVEPFITQIDFCIAINTLSLTIVDSNIVQVDGFCPYDTWIESNYDVLMYNKGIVRVLDNLEPGLTYVLMEIITGLFM